MCVATAYILDGSEEKPVCEYVCNIDVSDGSVLLTDILGQEIEVRGRIAKLDLVKNIVLIDSAGS